MNCVEKLITTHASRFVLSVVMTALRNRAGHYILPCGFFYLSAALNRGHHLCSAARPSHLALAHVLVYKCFLLRNVLLVLPHETELL